MDLSSFVSPDPATRRDGWSPERKLRFLDKLAASGNVRAACAAVGMSRESAYALRRRDALFARGWAAALLLAREASVEVLADKALEGIEEEVWYRGEMLGTKRRFDARLLLAHIARLDRLVEEADDVAAADAERFEEILACVAGAEVPEELAVEEEPLPLCREAALDMAGEEAAEAIDGEWEDREAAAEDADEPLGDEQYNAYRLNRCAAVATARAEAGVRWDAWFAEACARLDALREQGTAGDVVSLPRTPSDVSGSAGSVDLLAGSVLGATNDASRRHLCAGFPPSRE